MNWLGFNVAKKIQVGYLMENKCKLFGKFIIGKGNNNIRMFSNTVVGMFIRSNKIGTFPSYRNCCPNVHISINNFFKRFYNPRENINWVLIRFRHRVSQLRKKKLKYKNHSKVALRFRLTKFGWERLQSGRNASKKNLSAKKYNEKMKIRYVSRDDIKKFKFQMPSYVIRIRDSPVDYNPNIMKARKFLPSHFG
ncbi:conserved Plasmodium protein, unknown function [Plasmodium ovale wallikeri]|uniref:Uncharacterized protein n=1 Tax=Plasmodium ovale wallikeri TaxID=864142 RepID=A0A1A8YPF1_PLAOA|nr:conserved Plasmodium protein, unknown function [Plasmodium ovale wallikeri]SBT33287.1 conserved Plasmodium protein, unknown function [Plasmodium ovale wallikeri]